MLKLTSISFKDDDTNKIIEVHLTDDLTISSVTANQPFSADEFAVCGFNSGLLVAGGVKEVRKFAENKK